MFKRIFLLAFCLVLVFSVQANSGDNASEEAKIKAAIKKAFITEELAYAQTVEHGGQNYEGKKPTEAFADLAEFMSNKKGYLDHLKGFINLKDANEQLHFAKVKKRKFKDFDFKSINIDGGSATVEVDIYTEVTTTIGATVSVTQVLDEYDNVIENKVYESEPHDIVTPGGYKHNITMEKMNNKWQIVWDDYDFLPDYRP